MAKESADKKKQKVKRPTPLKRDLQNQKRKVHNRDLKSRVKTAMRTFEEALKGDAANAKEKLNEVYSILDKAVKKGLFKLNKASRTKSRLTAKVK